MIIKKQNKSAEQNSVVQQQVGAVPSPAIQTQGLPVPQPPAEEKIDIFDLDNIEELREYIIDNFELCFDMSKDDMFTKISDFAIGTCVVVSAL